MLRILKFITFMFVREKTNSNSYKVVIQLVENVRFWDVLYKKIISIILSNKMSSASMHNVLQKIQISILKDYKTKHTYAIQSKTTQYSEKIMQLFGKKWSDIFNLITWFMPNKKKTM